MKRAIFNNTFLFAISFIVIPLWVSLRQCGIFRYTKIYVKCVVLKSWDFQGREVSWFGGVGRFCVFFFLVILNSPNAYSVPVSKRMELTFSHHSFLYSPEYHLIKICFQWGGQIYSRLFQIYPIGIYTLMPIGWKGRAHKSLDFALLWQKLSHCIRLKNKSKPGKGIASALCAGGVRRAWMERQPFHHICTTISKREVSLSWQLTAVGAQCTEGDV